MCVSARWSLVEVNWVWHSAADNFVLGLDCERKVSSLFFNTILMPATNLNGPRHGYPSASVSSQSMQATRRGVSATG